MSLNSCWQSEAPSRMPHRTLECPVQCPCGLDGESDVLGPLEHRWDSPKMQLPLVIRVRMAQSYPDQSTPTKDWAQCRRSSRLQNRLHSILDTSPSLIDSRITLVYSDILTCQYGTAWQTQRGCPAPPGLPGLLLPSLTLDIDAASKTPIFSSGVWSSQHGRNTTTHCLGVDHPVAFAGDCRCGAQSLHSHIHEPILPR
jgi:hypothetical protein